MSSWMERFFNSLVGQEVVGVEKSEDGSFYARTHKGVYFRLSEDSAEFKNPEPTVYVVRLLDFGNAKIHCIKALREYNSMGLREAKDLVESAPCTVFETTDKYAAYKLEADFHNTSPTQHGVRAEVLER